MTQTKRIASESPYTQLQITAAAQAAGWRGTRDAENGQHIPPIQWPTAHVCADADDGFKHLQAHVATTAFDSNDNVDAPKCHPNTRKAVLDNIMSWITIQTAIRIQWVLWLNGAAGAGKSAIGRSIVDLCLSQGIPIARFFLFRTDSTRNSLKPIVATLVHQLTGSIPELRSIIIPRIQADSLIFTKSLETQFETLIFGPLLQLQSESFSPQKTVVFLFDGVDECIWNDEQAKLIRIVTVFVKKQVFPMIALFGSRAENQLLTEFRSPMLSDILLQLALDTDYRANEDILRFLNDSFTKIKSTHPLGSELRNSNWPAQAEIDKMLQKASGQFIYASVVIKFISDPNQHPAQQLEIVLGLRPSGSLTPFAQLDALYRHIFSRVVDIEATSLVLAWEMFTPKKESYRHATCIPDVFSSWEADTACGSMTNAEIKVALAALTPVLTYTDYGGIRFLHASLPDFLLDQKRSQAFYIDQAAWCTKLSILTLRRLINKTPSELGTWTGKKELPTSFDFTTMVDSYLPHAIPTKELKELVTALWPEGWPTSGYIPGFLTNGGDDYHSMPRRLVSYIEIIGKWNFGDGVGGKVYRDHRKAIESYVWEYLPHDDLEVVMFLYSYMQNSFWDCLKLHHSPLLDRQYHMQGYVKV
ncbi:hypothetical protein HYPSUDRAFT_50020 [Hypholoma sublateritium FD-334 SS-4]|uniref:Nephrocystin 3-like N-terminal domain-containing protein n=1 Tax=Hypholoma sublateritium (strain FD-334 SS-4) TaxID=945553 RepID=A0A0D2KF58_HYPSF|nr:hypothetical protein HYPSUDRAFT_50020 [Hypholoma sublateritium FD-334 SS-4]